MCVSFTLYILFFMGLEQVYLKIEQDLWCYYFDYTHIHLAKHSSLRNPFPCKLVEGLPCHSKGKLLYVHTHLSRIRPSRKCLLQTSLIKFRKALWRTSVRSPASSMTLLSIMCHPEICSRARITLH